MMIRRQQRQQELVLRGMLRVFPVVASLIVFHLSAHALDRAQESIPQDSSPALCRFAVALPEMEGPLTLGIFSSEGTLVRLLYQDASIDSIPAGLNGLLITWDGKDDAGAIVPDGIYHALGLVHGKLTHSVMPWSESDWREIRSQDSVESSFFRMATPIWSTNKGSRLAVAAAPDALFLDGVRPSLDITAQLQGQSIVVRADGLPVMSIPLEGRNSNWQPGIELHPGNMPGTADVTVISDEGTSSYLISGLDHLVPLDAGSLAMPAGKN